MAAEVAAAAAAHFRAIRSIESTKVQMDLMMMMMMIELELR